MVENASGFRAFTVCYRSMSRGDNDDACHHEYRWSKAICNFHFTSVAWLSRFVAQNEK